jgi:tRNA(Ile)-lysidine synthase
METHPFQRDLAAAWPPGNWQDTRVVVAVSGGPDSVALLRGLASLQIVGRGRLTVAHFNHRLRANSAEDAKFVAKLAARLELPFELGEADTTATAKAEGDGIEAAARLERYQFLRATAERIGARYVVTGHTAGDQAETILHRIVRGTGIAGLGGMRRVRALGDAVTLLRPMLDITRREVLDYLQHIGQDFVVDASNESQAFARNRIRSALLPLIAQQFNPEIESAMLRLGAAASDVQRMIDRMVGCLLEEAVTFAGDNRATVDCERLAGNDRHLVRELFVAVWRTKAWPQQSMGFDHWDRLAEMALRNAPIASTALAQKQMFPGAIAAEKRAGQLILQRV